jgi:hypothetical protein
MALSLSESAKLSNDMVQRGVIETIIEESPILGMLPFETIEGNSLKYNQETTLGGAAFYAVNGTWTEATATFTQQTANLAILGGDADVDNFIQRVRSNIQDQRAVQTQLKAKSVARAFEDTFFYGVQANDTNSFDGLMTLVTSGQTVDANASMALATHIDPLIDKVLGTKPDLLVTTRKQRRALKALLAASAHYVERGESSFGRQVMMYDGIPVEISDFLVDTETTSAKTGGTQSSMWAIHFSAADGVVGLQNGGVEVVDLGQLESKDAQRVRIRWYVSIAVMRASALARVKRLN